MSIISDLLGKINEALNKEVFINYDLSNNYVAIYDEAYAVAKKRKKYLKNPFTKSYSYFTKTLIRLLFILLLNVVGFFFLFRCGYGCPIYLLVVITPILYLLLAIDIICFIFKVTIRKYRVKGTLKFDSNGLTDYTFDGIEILFHWDKIKMIVVKKNAVVILTDTPVYFFVNKELEKTIIKEIRRFKSNISVVKQDY